MQQVTTGYQRRISGARQLQAMVWHRGRVGGMAGLLLLPLRVRALGSGDLNTSFGGDGKVTTDFGDFDDATALAIQPHDARLVVAGDSSDDEALGSVFALARYHAITCNGVVATWVGTAGNDTLIGTNGPDVIVGFDGDDTIYGLGGNDLLSGNAGNDTLVGGPGDDTLVGDAGTDVCDGGSQIQGDTASGCESVTGVP
jgi:Ca2+-binding RTX toxin-like protein